MGKGFTLVELLIVIGILAVLTAAVVVVLNPAQLLAQARDSQRMSDLEAVTSAVTFYLVTADSPTLNTTTTCMVGTSNSGVSCVTVTSLAVTGTGWVRVNLASSTGGSPLATLPTDPVNSTNYYYAYGSDDTNKVFELNTRLESTKYREQMKNDGGNDGTCTGTYTDVTCYYETGTDPGFDIY